MKAKTMTNPKPKPRAKTSKVVSGSGDVWADLGLKRPSPAALRRHQERVDRLMKARPLWVETRKPAAPKSKAKTSKYVLAVIVQTDQRATKTAVGEWLRYAMTEAQGMSVSPGSPPIRITGFRVRQVDLD